MANIIGNNPDQWAKNQVNLRQQLLGLKNKTPEMLAWQTSKTAWIRAISAVQVDAKTAEELTGRQNFGGGKLAQEYVLFNGTIGLGQDTDKDGNTTYNQTTNLNSGVYAGQQPNNSAYGFEYETSRGLVPMPGIEDLSVTTYNRGSLRKASFKMKAYNKLQFSALDALFMRPGYTILLEWGHTNYFRGTPEAPIYTKANFNTLPFLMMNDFLDGNTTGSQTRLLAAIKKERGNGESGDGIIKDEDAGKVRGSQGNYDGFYGKITNFVWSLNPDGSYNIEVKAISTGDIIESLTIDRIKQNQTVKPDKIKSNNPSNNTYTFNLKTTSGKAYQRTVRDFKRYQYREYWYGADSPLTLSADQKTFKGSTKDIAIFNKYRGLPTIKRNTLKPKGNYYEPEEPGPQVLIANKDRSKLNAFLYKNYNFLKSEFKSSNRVATTDQENSPKIPTLNTFEDDEENGDLLMIQPTVQRQLTSGFDGSSLGGRDVASKNAPYQYIKLKKLLEFIEDDLLIYNGGTPKGEEENEENKEEEQIIQFDLDGENYMYTQPTQFSSDPDVCLIPFKFPTIDGSGEVDNSKFISYYNEVLKGCDFKIAESEYVANMLEIPVNLHYIGNVVKQTTSNGNVPLLRFLEQLFYGIQEALGSINKFSVTYNHDENTVVFRDDVPLDPTIATKTKVEIEERTLFNVNGVKPIEQNGSFIYSVGITTTLSNKFATMISIGAQANSTSDTANTTSFSKWNVGLRDSVTPSKLSKAGLNTKKSDLNKPFKIFKDSVVSLNKFDALLTSFYKDGKMPSGDVQSTAQNQNSNINKYITTIEDKEKVFNPTTKTTNSTKNPPSTQGFIPFSMNLSMDGFSGLRIYEKFYITAEILPPSYPRTLSFICKGMTHTINNSGWKTTIDSLTITSVDKDGEKLLTTPTNTYNLENTLVIEQNLKQ